MIPVTGKLFESALSPDGKTLAIYEVGRLFDYVVTVDTLPFVPSRLIDLATGGVTRLNAGDFAFSVAWSPDGKTLAAAYGGGWVSLWDVASSVEASRFTIPPGVTGDIAFLPDGQSLVIRFPGPLSEYGIWNLETGHITAFLAERYGTYGALGAPLNNGLPDGSVTFVIAPDGKSLLEATMYGRIRQLSFDGRDPVVLLDTENDRPMFPIRFLNMTADGARLVYLETQEKALMAFDIATKTETRLVDVESTLPPALSPDGQKLTWVQGESTLMIRGESDPGNPLVIDLAVEGLAPDVQLARGLRASPLHFAPDGSQVVFAGYMNTRTGESAILVIDLAG